MTKTSYLIILSTAMLLVAVSCRKKNDTPPPVVTLYSPGNDSKFNVGDTIVVTGQVSAVNHLQNANIGLLDNQFQPVSETVSLLTGNNDFNFSSSLIISNVELLPGTYYIRLLASDGINTSSDYKEIYLSALPKKRMGIYLVTAADHSSTHVAYIDSTHNAVQMITLSGDYSAAAISSIYNQLYVCGNYSGAMNAIDLANKNIAWTIPAANNSFPFFEGLNYTNGVCYVTYFNGNITGYNNVQSIQFAGKAQGAYYPVSIYTLNNSILVEHHEISGNGEKLVEYYSTGAAIQETPLNAKPVQMFAIDQYTAMLFGNNATLGVIEIYNSQTNVIHSLAGCDSINDAVQLDANDYILALTNGIYEYNYSTNNLIPFFPGVNASCIAYDDVNNELIAGSGNMVNVYDAGGSGLKYSVISSEAVKKILILYNK